MDTTSKYRLKKGKTHWANGRPYHEGEVVELTLRSFKALSDKFEPADPGEKTLDEPLTVTRPATAAQHSSEKVMEERARRV